MTELARIRFKILFLSYGLILVLFSGCATIGDSVEHANLDQNAPDSEQILADLVTNDRYIDNFLGRGVFVVESPAIDGRRKFRGNLKFQRPQKLYVQGTKLGGAIIVFRMISDAEEFLMEFPGDKAQSFYQIEGQEFEDIPFSVSPSDVAREMFLPEEWKDIKRRNIRIISFDPSSSALVVELIRKRRVHRRLTLAHLDTEAPRWVIIRNELLDADGRVLAITESTEYSKVGDALFPGKVDAYFPTEDTRMTFTMRNIRINTDIDPAIFDILERARELNLHRRENDGTLR